MQKIAKTILVAYVLSYFIIKTHLFDIDHFPRTFDMESPTSDTGRKNLKPNCTNNIEMTKRSLDVAST